jgi:hypothetical protein
MIRTIMMALILFTLASTPIAAQQHYFFFYGKVVDPSGNRGIADANITFEGSGKGASTDRKGEFSFYIDTIPRIMIISHLGYETKRVLIDKTSFSLIIYLEPKVQQLREVLVTAKSNPEPFFQDVHYNVFDYETDSSCVYLLVSDIRNSMTSLICKNFKGDTLAWSVMNGLNTKKLFKDCLGNIHVLTGDSAYQVFREKSNLLLIYPTPMKRFREVLMNCVLSTAEDLYMKKADKTGQSVSYYKIDRKSSERTMLTLVEDSLKKKMLRLNTHDYDLLMQSTQPLGRQDFVDWSYVHKILYRPVSTALTRIGDFICIFNTADKTIEFYRPDGSYAYKLLLMTGKVKDGTWSKEIFTDETRSQVFTTFMKNGYCTLYRIDLNTGELVLRLHVEHLYPEKITMQNGFVFYLYHVGGSGDNRELYRESF